MNALCVHMGLFMAFYGFFGFDLAFRGIVAYVAFVEFVLPFLPLLQSITKKHVPPVFQPYVFPVYPRNRLTADPNKLCQKAAHGGRRFLTKLGL